MGKAANGGVNSNAGVGKEPRITLRNYLDMSRSMNVEPSLRHQKNHARKWDMTKSLNADPGFFSNINKSSRLNSVVAANSPIQELPETKDRGEPRSKVKDIGTSLKSPLSQAGFLSRSGLNNKTLPTSPSVTESPQEKQLIDAFVDQLRSIAASSSEPATTTRRVVRKALEFSSNLNAAQKAVEKAPAAMDPAPAGGASASSMDLRKSQRLKLRFNGVEEHNQKRNRQLFPLVEEKQTVISSPIIHAAGSSITRTKLKSVDMAPVMQEHAIECASQLLKGMDKLNCKLVAWQLKKEFDKIYGPAWHCIVGTSFGSYVTHSVGGFIYFAVGKVSILLFRTAIEVVERK